MITLIATYQHISVAIFISYSNRPPDFRIGRAIRWGRGLYLQARGL
jgi:hypothetical protein